MTPVQLWHAIIGKYKVAQTCEREIARLDAAKELSKIDELKREAAVAVATAAESLSRLLHAETRGKLEEFARREASRDEPLLISHSNEFVVSTNPLFWFSCFVRLSPRGDCFERCSERSVLLPSWRWAKCLLTRSDTVLWRTDVEFVACLYNIFCAGLKWLLLKQP